MSSHSLKLRLPLDVLLERDLTVTNGVGINALAIAEYVMMGMLNIGKGYRDVEGV